ncbi:MAG: rod shape-determining protein MreD [Geminicoccaceae bacterium]|nr:rod shape-determining protein MreD [Geminicoccaceae bacterium]MCS7266503.1 rod shape-determining protein MreD [Geminicoccaceae bacterium]MCX7630192.1 rod shape-determining protein MreD [Geminicoccaceae bacterium]MDW8123901.1 rod shape-determining protein MreD [Geminicoccaceae bacterium]MDW8340036.1 rod shape-determining protein MreD [Geminicoccaceae bacterium]
MSETPLSGLALALKRSLAFATALFAVACDLLPLPGPAPDAVAPLFALAVVYHWTIRRPDLFTPSSAFLLGILRDLAGGLPAGLHALTFLLPSLLLGRAPRALLRHSATMAWLSFLPVVAVAAAVRWGLGSLVWMRPLPVSVFVAEALWTAVIYPLVASALVPVERVLPGAERVPGS